MAYGLHAVRHGLKHAGEFVEFGLYVLLGANLGMSCAGAGTPDPLVQGQVRLASGLTDRIGLGAR